MLPSKPRIIVASKLAVQSQRALGRIAYFEKNLGEAETCLSQALETFEECSATFEAARTHLDLAAVRAAQGDKNTASGHFAIAVATFDAAEAPQRAAAAQDLARSLEITLASA